MKSKINRVVENTWNMLYYLYDELRTKKFRHIDLTKCETIDDLYALIISTWSMSLAKEGLYKEYIEIENDELTSPRGQINIAESIARQSQLHGALICSYDELSANIYLNHVIKGMLQYLVFDKNINQTIKVDIKKALQSFNGVSSIDINYISWKDVKFNNNNIRYKNLIEVCKTLYNEKKAATFEQLTDDIRMYILFKKQVLKYYLTEHQDDVVEIFEQPFTLDTESHFETVLNKSQRLVAIRTENQALLIEIRLQDEYALKDPTVQKQRLYELIGYVGEYNKYFRVKTAGTIIYVNTNPKKLNLDPIRVNAVDHIMVGETTVDINDLWRYVKIRMDEVYKYFIQKAKNKRGK